MWALLPFQVSAICCGSDFQLGALLEEAFENEGLSDGELMDDVSENEGLTAASPTASYPIPAGTRSAPAPSKRPSFSHRRRAAQRAKQKEEQGYATRPSIKAKYMDAAAPIRTSFEVEELPGARGGYTAKIDAPGSAKKRYTPEELERLGFTRIKWEGR